MEDKDGLLAIANAVLGDVQKEAENIILAAGEEAKNVLRKAKEEADKNFQSIVNDAKVKAEAEKRKIASLTAVEIKNQLLHKKEELVDLAFEKALGKLEAFVETERYHEYLIKQIEEATEKIGSRKLILQVNAKDKVWLRQETLKRLSERLQLELKLARQTQVCIGGCKIQTQDGKVTYDSTIDSRLEELKQTLRTQVAKILFVEVT